MAHQSHGTFSASLGGPTDASRLANSRSQGHWQSVVRRVCRARTAVRADLERTVGAVSAKAAYLSSAGNHPDHLELMAEEGKTEIGVDRVRSVLEQAALTRAIGVVQAGCSP